MVLRAFGTRNYLSPVHKKALNEKLARALGTYSTMKGDIRLGTDLLSHVLPQYHWLWRA